MEETLSDQYHFYQQQSKDNIILYILFGSWIKLLEKCLNIAWNLPNYTVVWTKAQLL